MKYAYYPGCVSKSTGIEYEVSTKAVCSALGVELEELPDWNCCGATHSSNDLLAVGLAARNLSQSDLPVLTSCSICYSNLRHGIERMKDPLVKDRINAVLDRKYSGSVVKHVVEVLADSFLGEAGKDKVVISLKGLKVAPYYGCLLTRPPGGIDSPENPTILERLISSLDATPVNFPQKMLCCGGPIFMSRDAAASKSSYAILRGAKEAGADLVLAACPLCHLMLDAKQKSIESRFKDEISLPVLYVTQLAGIALGLSPEDLCLEGNSISAASIVEGIYERLANESC